MEIFLVNYELVNDDMMWLKKLARLSESKRKIYYSFNEEKSSEL